LGIFEHENSRVVIGTLCNGNGCYDSPSIRSMSRNIRSSGSGWTKSSPMSNRNVLAIVRDANVYSLGGSPSDQETRNEERRRRL